jgi:hypothetical protein
MAGITVAGAVGSLHLSVAVLVILGVFISCGTGGTFACFRIGRGQRLPRAPPRLGVQTFRNIQNSKFNADWGNLLNPLLAHTFEERS